MLTYDIKKEDVDLQRSAYLRLCLIISFLIGVALFPFVALSFDDQVFVTPILVIASATFVSYFLNRRQQIDIASWVYIGGLLGGLGLHVWLQNPPLVATIMPVEILFVIPIGIASLLLNSRSILRVTFLAVSLMIVTVSIKVNLGTAIAWAAAPGFAAIVLAGIVYSNTNNTLDLVDRATDSQKKDAQRAEAFYEKSEQLREALLQLTHANSKLELMNTRLAEAQQKAERLSTAKSTFLSNMSHELRTPLNVIIGYSSSMLKMPGMFNNVPIHEVHRPYLKLIEENGYYLVGLINDILDLSKIEAGKLELHCSTIGLPDLLRGVLATSIGLVKDKPIQLRPDFSENLPPVWADSLRTRQIILNLMSNAIKFTESGSITLNARVEGSFVRIAVTDTGIGIPEKALTTIFDRFQQAEHDTDKQYGGTGLGLDISKQLCSMHGGEMTVQSVVGQGSTFAFTLPISTESQLESDYGLGDLEGGIEVFASTARQPITTQMILVVEDEVSMRDMLHKTLEGAGHLVVDTNDGLQALEIAVGILPNMIILDVHLPEISGWDVLQRLKQSPETESIPVVICTADEDFQRAKDLGAISYLHKPVTPEKVLDCVAQVIASTPKTEGEPQP